jgi:hypothetical protein
MDGEASRLPDTWASYDGLTYCLSCCRARAAEAALESATESASNEDRVRLRRSALIAFEIRRMPAAPDRAIANACRTSSKTVAVVRDELTCDQAPDERAATRVA